MARRARAVRVRPAPPRRGGEDAPGLRHRPRPVRDVVRGAVARSGRGDAADAAPLRRDAVGPARRRDHRRAQARGPARVLPGVARARRDRPEPGRPDPGAQASAQPAAGTAPGRDGRRARPHPRLDAARAPRPRAVRGRLLERPARRGARDARRDVGRLRRRGAARRGQGRQDADRAGGRARAAGGRALPRAGAPRPRATATATRRCSSRSPAGGCRPPTSGGGCARGPATRRCRAASRPIPCATRSPRTCSRAVPTCGRSRSFSGTLPSPRRRFTLG